MPSDEFLAANRRNWDERVPIHRRDRTGLDVSPAAIAEARRLADKTGLAAEFVCANVYDARQTVAGDFDIAFVTWGTICWLPDLVDWAQTIADLLAPGGYLYFADAHPNMLILEEKDGRL